MMSVHYACIMAVYCHTLGCIPRVRKCRNRYRVFRAANGVLLDVPLGCSVICKVCAGLERMMLPSIGRVLTLTP